MQVFTWGAEKFQTTGFFLFVVLPVRSPVFLTELELTCAVEVTGGRDVCVSNRAVLRIGLGAT